MRSHSSELSKSNSIWHLTRRSRLAKLHVFVGLHVAQNTHLIAHVYIVFFWLYVFLLTLCPYFLKWICFDYRWLLLGPVFNIDLCEIWILSQKLISTRSPETIQIVLKMYSYVNEGWIFFHTPLFFKDFTNKSILIKSGLKV